MAPVINESPGTNEPLKIPMSSDNHHYGPEDDELSQESNPAEIKPWDEGGVSDCGYSTGVHDTLMSVGQSVHNIIGSPSESVKTGMGSVGNWFQEASYAVRDIVRGDNSKEFKEDASTAINDAINTIMTAGSEKNNNNVSPSSAAGPSTTAA